MSIAFEDGRSALLLRLSGTLPVLFRGSLYSFPVSIWIPQSYPQEPPMIFVTAAEGMMLRPGQHVSDEGRVYHRFLAHWIPEVSAEGCTSNEEGLC